MFDPALIARMLALGLVAGVFSGMFGIGGGLVIVPALVLGFGLDQKVATGTSLFALIWPVGLLGVLEFWRNGKLRADYGAWIAVGLFFGAYFGARITIALPPATLKRLYGIFLLIAGVYYLLQPALTPRTPATPPGHSPAPPAR